MVKLRRLDRPGRHPVWVEVYPERCPGCAQPYRGGHVAVGYLTCGCEGAENGAHRTLFCRDCHFEVFLPPHLVGHGPRADGRDTVRPPAYDWPGAPVHHDWIDGQA